MATPSSGRRRVAINHYAAEDQVFDQISKEAEARLAAKRQARAEAREIRMKELEKLQKEADEQSDRNYELLTDVSRGIRPTNEIARTPSYMSGSPYAGSPYSSSRRSSEDSTDTIEVRELRAGLSGNLKLQLSDLEEKFRKAMISNAQLDNEKTAYIYQVETLKDEIEEMQENLNQSQRDYREKKQVYDQLVRDYTSMQQDNACLLQSLKEREQLIKDHGLVLVSDKVMNGDIGEDYEPKLSTRKRSNHFNSSAALLSQQSATLLEQIGNGSLDVRLKKFVEEKQELLDEIYRLRLDLEEERQKLSKMENTTVNHNHVNGPDIKVLEVQREANKQLGDYKFRLKKAEQEITTLQSNIARLESQVSRYKTATENAEKTEDDLKAEKRKVFRELREAQARIEELETSNTHLQKRIDKLKSARNTLIKN